MKLNELQLTQNLKDTNNEVYKLKAVFKKHGWKFLGTGFEASVAEHPDKKYVIKVFLKPSFYSKFVSIVKRHTDNPHFPQFSRYIRPVPGTKFLYVRMEKLKPVTLNQLLGNYLSEITWLATNYAPSWKHYIADVFIGKYKTNLYDLTTTEIWQIIPKPSNEWIKALELLVKFHSMGLDLHSNNMMLRKKTLVIIDPYV